MSNHRTQDVLTALIALTLAACIGAVALSTVQRAAYDPLKACFSVVEGRR